MITNINNFLLQENIQQAKSILKKKGLDPETEDGFEVIKTKLKKVPNLIGTFTYFRYEMEEDMTNIVSIMDWVINNRDKVGQLPKNITQYDTLEEIDDDIKSLGRKTSIKKFYKGLYSSMRKAVDNLNEEDKKKFDDLALSYTELSEEERNLFTPLKYFEKNNVSINEFMESLQSFISDQTVNGDKKSVMEKLKSHEGKYKIPYNENNILVIESNDKETICDLGSQNWCIVYSPDTYGVSYYGPKTYNTQFIVYNFNLPTSSANSMFGITLGVDGQTKSGGCQNKRNEGTTLEKVLEYTGIPDNIIVPNPSIVKIKNNLGVLTRIVTEADSDYIKITKFIEDNLMDDKEFDTMSVVTDLLANNINKDVLKFKNTFNNKTVEEILELIKNPILSNIISNIEIYNYITFCLTLNDKNNAHLLLINRLANLKRERQIENYKRMLENNSWDIITDYDTYFNNLSITAQEVKSLFDKIPSEKSWDDFWVLYRDVLRMTKEKQLKKILVSPSDEDFDSFEKYKSVYDKYQLSNDDTPYDAIFDEYDNLGMLTDLFHTDENYYNFLKDNIINREKDTDAESAEFIERLILDTKSGDDTYTSLDDDDIRNFIFKLIEELNIDMTSVVKSSHIIGLALYKETGKYKQAYNEALGIKTTKDGTNYVVVDLFSEFDGMLFENDYFENIDDYTRNDWYDDSHLEMDEWYDELDDYNIVMIADTLLNIDDEIKKHVSRNTIKTYKNKKGQINSKLTYKYGSDENLIKLKNQIKNIIFEGEDNEIFENDDLYMTIDDEIVTEILKRGYQYAQEAVQYDYIFDKLIDAVGDSLGSVNWTPGEGATTATNDTTIYKWSKENSNLLFTINLSHIVKDIDSYADLMYNLDDTFDWEDLVQYVVKELGSEISMSYEFDQMSTEYPDKKSYNEALRNV